MRHIALASRKALGAMGIMASLLMTGCASASYQTVTFNVLRPAAYTLPTWMDTIVVADATTSPVYKDNSLDPDNQTAMTLASLSWKAMPRQVAHTVAEDIRESKYLTVCEPSVSLNSHAALKALTDSVFKNSKHTLVLALTDLTNTTDISMEKGYDEEGTYTDCATMTCATRTLFTLYYEANGSTELEARNDTLIFTSCGDTNKDIAAGLPNIPLKYQTVAENSGHKMSDMIIPSWQKVRRRLYASTNKKMIAADNWVRQENWEEARNIWNEMSTTGKTQDKIFAMMNIAVSYEREDDIRNAAIWCSKTLDLLENANEDTREAHSHTYKVAQEMFAYLMEREKEKVLLDKQMD